MRKLSKFSALIAATSLLGTSAWANTLAEQDQQRDVNQQQHIDRMQARDLRKGSISPVEQMRLNAAANSSSAAMYNDKRNGTTGTPASASSERLQSDVQRNVYQQRRIANGMHSGTLTNREAGRLERGQAHVDRREANAAHDGYVGAFEQRRIQRYETHQSSRIFSNKHNAGIKG